MRLISASYQTGFSGRLTRKVGQQFASIDWQRSLPVFLWGPIAFAFGCILYFALPVEPARLSLFAGLGVAIVLSVLAISFFRYRAILFSSCILLAIAVGGFVRAQHHTISQDTIFVEDSERAVSVTGWIEAVQSTGGRQRIILRVSELEGYSSPPRRVRFFVQRGGFVPGDGISTRVVLSSPNRPAVPGGYDPSFAAWFSGLGGGGYAISTPEAAEVSGDTLLRALARMRWSLAEHIRQRAHPETAGIAAALITGDRSGIPPDQAEALRAAGLGHILAISGLHMSLFAGGLFFFIRAVGAAIPSFARRHDPRVPAAIIALIGASIYLVVSGMSVSTQRAYVMIGCILLAVVFRRRALSMQSLALAAGIVLVLQPQSILSAGFQMSFAAAAALIAAFDVARQFKGQQQTKGLLSDIVGFWGSLSLSSLVAGSATAAFGAFHFNRIAVFGFGANLLAMPLFSLVVMPAGAIAMALAPFGLDGPALTVMSWGLIGVVGLAEWVSNWPGALSPVPSAPGLAVLVYAAGFVGLVLSRTVLRLFGLVVMAAAFAIVQFSAHPDGFISQDGVVLARFETEDGPQWASSDRRRSRFAQRVFLEEAGEPVAPVSEGIFCDSYGCAGRVEGVGVLALNTAETLSQDCRQVALIIVREPVSPIQRAACAALVVDMDRLDRMGAHSFQIDGNGALVLTSVEARRGRRPWALNDNDG